ncbi:MAG: DegT/DnrJ/EryC1/StrS family aminotransferase [Afipia sp.]|nr:DegT/DnrJ/EryC1/StrS family aminotransferase [Afipia sp.]
MTQVRKIQFGKPWITEAERNAVLGVLAGDVLTHGPQAHEFEKEFVAAVGGGHALTLSNGTAALHLAYWQLGIGAGDEVIVPAQTHVATVHAVEIVGARPVFVDCDTATGNVTPQAIEAAITPKTRAIGIVHFVGIPCDMPAIMKIAAKHDLKVVEDCALALGTRWDGVHAGLFGDAGTFSFYPVKHITTGDGGMLITRHDDLAKKISKARAFGVDRTFVERSVPGVYDVLSLGINYRLSDINSAIGREQLKRLATIQERRAKNFTALKSGLAGLEDIAVLDRSSRRATGGSASRDHAASECRRHRYQCLLSASDSSSRVLPRKVRRGPFTFSECSPHQRPVDRVAGRSASRRRRHGLHRARVYKNCEGLTCLKKN